MAIFQRFPPAPYGDQSDLTPEKMSMQQRWDAWWRDIKNTVETAFVWTNFDFTGSDLDDIVQKDHNQLDAMQGGNSPTDTEMFHLDATQHDDLTSTGGVDNADLQHAHAPIDGADHGNLVGLADDDHTQYHTDERADDRTDAFFQDVDGLDWDHDDGANTFTPVLDPQQALYAGMSSQFIIQSDFTDPIGAKVTPNLHAVTAGVGAIIAGSITDPADHPGIWRMLTGVTAVGRVFILSIAGGVIVGTIRVGAGGITRCGTWIHTGAILSTALERYTIRAGMFAISLPNTIDEGIGFEYDDSQNGGRWQAICGDAPGVETSTDTGITVAASTWYKLEFEVNAAGTSVEFFIDDVSVATVAANIPVGVAFHLFYNTHIMKLIGTTSREMEIDAMYLYKEITR